MFVVVPFSPKLVAGDLDVGIFYALAVGSVSTIGHPHGRVVVGEQVLADGRACAPAPS